MFLDLDTTLRVDLTELFVDLDGDTDLGKLRVIDIHYDEENLNMSDATVTPPVVDRYPNQIRVPIATTTSGLTVPDPVTGNPIVQFGGEPTEPSLIAMPAGSAIDFHNTIWPGQIASLNNLNYPSSLMFDVEVTDDTLLPALDANGDLKTDGNGNVIYEAQTWDVVIEVRPNPDTYTSSEAWRRETSAPGVDYRPWVVEVTPKLDPTVDDSLPRVTVGKSLDTSLQSVYGYNTETVGGVDVDLNAGQFRRYHDLILDGSGSVSELAIPGLIYESAIVNPQPVIRFRTNDNGTPGPVSHLTISDVTDTGVYGWEYSAVFSNATLKTSGETAVIATGEEAIFGLGWNLQGVPSITVDRNIESDTSPAHRALDDHLVLAFPGEQPKVFNAADLTFNNFSFAGKLNSLQPGSTEIDHSGFANPQEFGKLTSRQNPDELVYDDGTGQEYIFAKYVNDQGTPADTTDDITFYLIDRIEQPGTDATAGVWNSGRRGLSFQWDTTTHAHPVLTAIEASDTSQAVFAYDAAGYLASITGAGGVTTEFTINNDHELTEIRHVSGSGDRVRTFAYSNGLMTTDQWYDDNSADPTKLARHTEFAYNTDGLLSQIQFGDGVGADQNTVVYDIDPAALRADLTATVAIDVPDLAKYDEAMETGVANGGVYETLYKYSLDGLLERRAEYFDGLELSRESWTYDQIGFVKSYTDQLGQQTIYWHDYEEPADYQTSADDDPLQLDDSPKYDPDDYRGNITYVFTPAGMTAYEYETDDEAQLARGKLRKTIDKPKISATGSLLPGGTASEIVTEYGYYLNGLLESKRTIRGDHDLDPFNPPAADGSDADHVEKWTYVDGQVQTYTDARGLTTTYAYDAQQRLASITFTDQGIDLLDTSDDETRTTEYSYDAFGLADHVIVYNGSTSGDVISIHDVDYAPTGLLTQDQVLDANNTVLSRTQYEYAPDGYVTAVIDGNGVRTESTYDKAGLLTELKEAAGQTYYSLYTGQDESVEQTTTYAYYADGSLRQTTRPDGAEENAYADPINQIAWTVTSGVSDGCHTLSGSTVSQFKLDGAQVVKETSERAGHKGTTVNLLTGAETMDDLSELNGGSLASYHSVGPAANRRTAERKYSAWGDVLSEKSGGQHDVFLRDELGYLTESADRIAGAVMDASKYNPAGDLVEYTEHRRMPNAVGWLTQYFTTLFEYDQQGRLRRTIDPLTNPNDGWTDEILAAPAVVGYAFDPSTNATKVTTTSRAGVSTYQWFDAAGRLVQEQNEYGGIAEFDYDLAGNRIEERFTPVAGDGLSPRRTTFDHDALGRLRTRIVHGGDASFTATDYFLPNHAGADGWNQVNFITLPGTDPVAYRSAVGPSLKNMATRVRMDSLGNPYYIQQPDPSEDPNDTPTILITYSYVPILDAHAVTTRLSVGENVDSSTSPNISPFVAADPADPTAPSNEQVRVTREVTNARGETVITAARMSSFQMTDFSGAYAISQQATVTLNAYGLDPADYLQIDTDGDGKVAPDQLLPNDVYVMFMDSGFQVVTRNEFYSDTGLLKTTFDGRGNDTALAYTHRGEIESITDAKAYAAVYVYDSAGNLIKETDARCNSTRYTYDALGRRTKVLGALNNEVTYDYQVGGDYVEETDARGFMSIVWRDPASRTMEVIDGAGQATLYEYDSAGNVVKETDFLGQVTRYEYDGLNRRIKTIDALTQEYVLVYDVVGNLSTEQDPTGSVIKHDYDTLGRRTKTTANTAHPNVYTLYTYDVSGNVTSVRDEVGDVTKYFYDGGNRLQKVIDAELGETVYGVDEAGNVTWEKLPNGAVTEYGYDERNQLVWINRYDRDLNAPLVELNSVNGSSISFHADIVSDWEHSVGYDYNANGDLLWEKDPRAHVTDYEYYPVVDLVHYIRQPDPGTNDHGRPETEYTYYADGSVQTVTDPMGRSITYTYDGQGRTTHVTDAEGSTVTEYTTTTHPTYGTVRKIAIRDKENSVTTKILDPLGRVIEIQQPDPFTGYAGGPSTKFTYTPHGQQELVTDPLGEETYYAYDDFNRLSVIGEKMQSEPIGAIAQVAAYDYYPDGTVYQYADRAMTVTTYEYDGLKRRTKSTTPNNGVNVITEWAYDAVGNLTTLTTPNGDTVTYVYDDLGQLTTETTSGSRTYAYDPAGNLVQRTDRLNRVIAYQHDDLNRRIQETWVGDPQNYIAITSYNADGSLKSATDGLGGAVHSSCTFGYDSVGRNNYLFYWEPQTAEPIHEFYYAYDKLGQLKSRALESGAVPTTLFTTGYGRDKLGRIDLVTQWGTRATELAVDYVYAPFGSPDAGKLKEVYRYEDKIAPDFTSYVSHSVMDYDPDGRLQIMYHYGQNVPVNISAYSYQYDSADRVSRMVPSVGGVPQVTEIQNWPYDDLGQAVAVTRDSGETVEQFIYDANGNRLGVADSYDRLRDDGAHRFEYDAEGNVEWRWNLDTPMVFALDEDNEVANPIEPIYSSEITAYSSHQSLNMGWYRLRIPTLNITSVDGLVGSPGVDPGPVEMTVRLYRNELIFDTVLFQNSSPYNLQVTASGGLGEYTTNSVTQDFFLANNESDVYLQVELRFPNAPPALPDIEVKASVYLDRFKGIEHREYDYRNRVTKIEQYGAPLSNSDPSGPSVANAERIHVYHYRYDVFDNLIGKSRYSGDGTTLQDSARYLNDRGRRLIEFDDAGRIERHYLYSADVDELLAVEDFDYAADNSVLSDELLWALTDQQGTVRDLFVAGSSPEHLRYDPFGRRQESWAGNGYEDTGMADSVMAGFRGMMYDPETDTYITEGRVYDPLSGRFLSEHPGGYAAGDTNLYLFAGNTPANRKGASLASPWRGGGDSFGAVFAEYFSDYVNPATNWREGNYGWAIPQTLGWVAFVVGTGGAGALAGGTTTAGTATAGSVATYLGTQAGISAAETAVEGSLAYATGSDYNWATGFGKNMWVNTATGGIGGSFKVGGRAGAYLARQGIEIAGDTAIDVGVYGNDLGSSLAWNTVGSIGGEAVFNGLGRGLRQFHETFEISFNRGALTTFTTGVPIDFVSVGRRAPGGTVTRSGMDAAAKAKVRALVSEGVPVRAAVRSVQGRGIRPRDFGLRSIADDAHLNRLWSESIDEIAGRTNATKLAERYQKVRAGTATGDEARYVFDEVRDAFLTRVDDAMDAGHVFLGFDFENIHHWNWPISTYNARAIDPTHLFPTSKAMHDVVHNMTTSGARRYTPFSFFQPISPRHVH